MRQWKRFLLCAVVISLIVIGPIIAKSFLTYAPTATSVAAANQSRDTITYIVRTPVQGEGFIGAYGFIAASNCTNPGDAAFGGADSMIVTPWFGSWGYRKYMASETLAGLPDTFEFYNEADSNWQFADTFGFNVIIIDSTTDFDSTNDTLKCTVTPKFRVWQSK